jgi:hypothetical protein
MSKEPPRGVFDELSEFDEETMARMRLLLSTRLMSSSWWREQWERALAEKDRRQVQELAAAPRITAAIAGSHRVYRNYCSRQQIAPRDLRYVAREPDLRCLRGCRLIVLYGASNNREVWRAFRELAEAGHFSEVLYAE